MKYVYDYFCAGCDMLTLDKERRLQPGKFLQFDVNLDSAIGQIQDISMELEEVEKHIGQQIRMLRIERKMSQKDFAEKLGITYQQVQKYEIGTNRISVARVWQVCNIFSISPDFLFSNILDFEDKKTKADSLIPNSLATAQDVKMILSFKKIDSHDDRNLVIKLCKSLAKLS